MREEAIMAATPLPPPLLLLFLMHETTFAAMSGVHWKAYTSVGHRNTRVAS